MVEVITLAEVPTMAEVLTMVEAMVEAVDTHHTTTTTTLNVHYVREMTPMAT